MTRYGATLNVQPAALEDAALVAALEGDLLERARRTAEADGLTIDPATAVVERHYQHPELEGDERYPQNAALLALTVEAH